VVALADVPKIGQIKKIIPLLPTKNITMETINISEDSYEPPRIDVVEVSVEKGFADSIGDLENGGNW